MTSWWPLTAPVSVITSSNSDALKYQAIRFRTGEFDEGTVDSILASMSDSTFMTGAFIAAIDNAIKKHDYEGAASRMNDYSRVVLLEMSKSSPSVNDWKS